VIKDKLTEPLVAVMESDKFQVVLAAVFWSIKPLTTPFEPPEILSIPVVSEKYWSNKLLI